MSAHRILFDAYKAPFEEFIVPDPGFATTFEVNRWGELFPLNSSAAAVAVTLAAPTKGGILCSFWCVAYSNSCVLTVTNYDTTTYALTFTAAKKQVVLMSGPVGLSSPVALNQNNQVQGLAEQYNWVPIFSNL